MTIEEGLEELSNTGNKEIKKSQKSDQPASAVPELFPVEKAFIALECLHYMGNTYLESYKNYEIKTEEFNEKYHEFMENYDKFIQSILDNCATIHNIAEEWDNRFEGLVSEIAEKNQYITVPSTAIVELVDEVEAALNDINQASLQAPDKNTRTDNHLTRSMRRINQLFFDIKGTRVLTDLVILNRSIKDNAKRIYEHFQIDCGNTLNEYGDVKANLKRIADFCAGKENVRYRREYSTVKRLEDLDNKKSWIKIFFGA